MNDFQSKLPIYQATRSKDFPAFLIVYCGHDNCPGTKADRPFLVSEREWLRPQRLTSRRTNRSYTVVGRACPYCFRSGRIPARRTIAGRPPS